MFTHPLYKPLNEQLYAQGRATPYDPSDPYSQLFFPVAAQDLKEDVKFYRDTIKKYADNACANYLDNDKVDFEFEDMPPSDAAVFIASKVEDITPTMQLKTVPRGGILEASLAVDQALVQSWSQPVLFPPLGRMAARNYLIDLNPKRFNASLLASGHERLKASQAECGRLILNTPNLAFAVHTIKIPKSVYETIVECGWGNGRGSRGNISIPVDDATIKTSELVEIPSLFTVTDGASLFIDFRFDLTWEKADNGVKRLKVGLHAIPEDILDFWKDLPHLYSSQADSSIQCLSSYIKAVYNCDIGLKAFDIGALAVMAGCKMDDYSLCALHTIVYGTGFPDFIENMDNSWAQAEIPVYTTEYKVRKLTYICGIYNTLMGHILRTYFPEVDVVLASFNMTQLQFIGWFTHGLGEALVGADLTKIKTEMTRIQMIRCMNPDSKLLGAFAELCIAVPCLGDGGARFLHSALQMFLQQYYVVRGIVSNKMVSGYHKKSPDVTSDLLEKKDWILFGRSFQSEDDSGSPAVKGLNGLQANPQFTSDLLDFNPKYDGCLKIKSQVEGRPLKLAVAEWGRLNLSYVRILLQNLNKVADTALHPYWTNRLNLYTRLRNMLENVQSEQQYVETLEYFLTTNKENVTEHMEAHEKELKLQQHRLESLKAAATPELPLKQALQQTVYKNLPGNHTAYNNKRQKMRVKLRKAKAAENGEKFISRKKQRHINKLALLESRLEVAKKAHVPGMKLSKPVGITSVPSTSNTSKAVSFGGNVKKVDGPNKGSGWKKRNRKRKGKGNKPVADLRLKLNAKQ
jgi:hypothetical protein